MFDKIIVAPLKWEKIAPSHWICKMGFAIGGITKARKSGYWTFSLMGHYSDHPSIDAAKGHAQKMHNDMIAASILGASAQTRYSVNEKQEGCKA